MKRYTEKDRDRDSATTFLLIAAASKCSTSMREVPPDKMRLLDVYGHWWKMFFWSFFFTRITLLNTLNSVTL